MPDPRADHLIADVLYASDLHGHEGLYLEFFETAWRLRARAAILGGDLAPHADVAAQRKFYSEFFVPMAREYFGKPGAADLYYIAGNDDWKASMSVVEEAWYRPAPVHPRPVGAVPRRAVDRGPRVGADHALWNEGLGSLGRGPVAGGADGRIQERARGRPPRLHVQRTGASGVPRGRPGRDRDCRLRRRRWSASSTARPTAPRSIRSRAASTSARARRGRFLERRRPLLGLHGHIHESPAVSGKFADRLGPTICVNAGQKMGSSLHAVWFSLDDIAGTLTHSLLGKAAL